MVCPIRLIAAFKSAGWTKFNVSKAKWGEVEQTKTQPLPFNTIGRNKCIVSSVLRYWVVYFSQLGLFLHLECCAEWTIPGPNVLKRRFGGKPNVVSALRESFDMQDT